MNVMLTSKDASARVRRWQRGGTVTGVIVGLIVGLTVAVWVAMTILKTPLPFVDKISKQSQPAGELGDPNKTMPGGARERRERISEDQPAAPAAQPVAVTPSEQSAAAKSAKTAKAEAPPAATAPATLPPSEKSRTEKAPTTANTSSQPSSPTPAGNSANSNPPPASNAASTPATAGTAAPSTTAAPQLEGFTYYLQAGAFREINDAEATKAKLALMGVAATIAERKSELGTLYRVRVGPFSEIEAMNRARLRLSDNGVDAAVVKVPK
ncbi:MAG: hypothetical protein RLZ09_987 [Pseudomonadota bacterium]